MRLIDRLLKSDHAIRLDTLDEIASKLGLQAWQLLLEGFDPAAPQTMPMTSEEKVTLDRLRALFNKT